MTVFITLGILRLVFEESFNVFSPKRTSCITAELIMSDKKRSCFSGARYILVFFYCGSSTPLPWSKRWWRGTLQRYLVKSGIHLWGMGKLTVSAMIDSICLRVLQWFMFSYDWLHQCSHKGNIHPVSSFCHTCMYFLKKHWRAWGWKIL